MRIVPRIIQFKNQATHCLGDWMETQLTFSKQHNRCMNIAGSVEASLQTHTKIYRVVLESVRPIQVTCVHVVALYGSKLM